MNTCGTNIPYLLTANHCVSQGGSLQNWVFQFFYFSTDCNTNVGYREDVQFNSCVLRSNDATSDFALLQLNQTPPINSGICYSGWNKSLFPASSSTGLHHPNRDVMKIAASSTPVRFYNGSNYSHNSHWEVTWNFGITASGSSGSPLYDPSHRILGQLHDGTSFCATPQGVDWYGSFYRSWTGGGTNTTRLSNWLDPSGTGATVTNTTNVANLPNSIPPTANVIGYYTVNGGTTQYSITNDTYQQLYVPRNSNGIINFYITSATFPFYTWNYDNITSPNLQFGASYTASPYGYGSITKNYLPHS